MTTSGQAAGWRLWVEGSRPRTLGAAVAPVLVGTAAAATVGDPVLWRAAVAMIVSVGLQVGTNFANDYSDGIRGTDVDRVGPMRLAASGRVSPSAVRSAAIAAFGVAALAGLVLAIAVTPWLLVVGGAALAAGVLYTGGPRPYGYSGFGELAVLVFFGFVATGGTSYVVVERIPPAAWWGATGVGLLACALLLANNIRDVEGDRASGKRTLVVRLGRSPARRLYAAAVAVAFGMIVPLAFVTPWALLGLVAAPLAIRPVGLVLAGRDPAALIAALGHTGRLQLGYAALVALGLVVGR